MIAKELTKTFKVQHKKLKEMRRKKLIKLYTAEGPSHCKSIGLTDATDGISAYIPSFTPEQKVGGADDEPLTYIDIDKLWGLWEESSSKEYVTQPKTALPCGA